jgi:6-phosphogluconolactonase/glucosamine-6-phosphate isomerase/deaminase
MTEDSVATGGGGTAEPTISVLPSPDEAAAFAARTIADALIGAARERGRADWATTGGSTPIPIYLQLVQPPLRDAVPWDRVHVWWGDDRVVPRDHPLSNRLPFDQVLLRAAGPAGLSGTGDDAFATRAGDWPGVPIPEANIHAMPIDLAIGRTSSEDEAAKQAAATYESALRAAPLKLDAAGFPILDVILVGIGPDGHVLSVFPGSELLDTLRWVAAVPAPTHVEPHVARVSLNPKLLTAARLPLAVVLGAGKAEIAAKILNGPLDISKLPAQIARGSGAVWVLDQAAAAKLPHDVRGRQAS